MGFILHIFVSSTCYDLRDLRATVKRFLESIGTAPQLSDDAGFASYPHLKPYVSCLKVLEECPLVIGIVDRRASAKFDDWAPYSQYNGLTPTHAELKHAVAHKKKLLLYVQSDTLANYQLWRKDPKVVGAMKAPVPDAAVFEMLQDLKVGEPIPPWVRSFTDATDIITSLQENLINEVYTSLREQERRQLDEVKYLIDMIEQLAPELRQKIAANLSDHVEELRRLKKRQEELETELGKAQQASAEADRLAAENADAKQKVENAQAELTSARAALLSAAVRDVDWLTFVRTRLMPKQPGRLPFHSDADVAIRGYTPSNMRDAVPKLGQVTWEQLPYTEGGLHRGYNAGLTFHGTDFAPGCTFAMRAVGETAPPTGHTDYWWRLPNKYFGNYLEVSTHDDPDEGAVSWRDTEFCARNPDGKTSEWVRFSYPFDDGRLRMIAEKSFGLGKQLLADGRFLDAQEALRKAFVMGRHIPGMDAAFVSEAESLREQALDKHALSGLRFRDGARVRVTAGENAGKVGLIAKLNLRWAKSYWIREDGSAIEFAASDDEVTAA
jgi:hypothetical protein